jgi:hypothetical protein
VANETSQGNLQARLIEALPLVAEKLPKPNELKAVSIGNGADGQVASLVAQIVTLLDGFRGNGEAKKLS